MSYSDFIKSIYNCIKAYSGIRDFSCSVFADGPERLDNIYRASQENAVLRNEYAEKFAGVINDFSVFRKIFDGKCELKESTAEISSLSSIFHGNSNTVVKIFHSCYPKNINRWMNGKTIRKIKCRVQFCALTWCWYDSWIEELNPDADKDELRNSMSKICSEYIMCDDMFSLEILWRACEAAYRNT